MDAGVRTSPSVAKATATSPFVAVAKNGEDLEHRCGALFEALLVLDAVEDLAAGHKHRAGAG